MDEKEFVSLYDGGDRTIIVGENEDGQTLYRVSSVAMSMASPIWRAMFNPASGFRESNPDLPVEFPEDDPDMLLILLRIAHLQFQHLPESLSFKWLTELAVLCDKYDAVGLVQPFIENWMSPWTLLCLEPGYEDWLFIAWTFGCHQIFGLLTASLVISVEVDNDGNISQSGNKILVDRMPPGSTAGILKVREQTIAKVLDLCQETIEKLMDHQLCNNENSHCHRTDCDTVACNNFMLALFVRALYPLGLGSQRPTVSEVKISLSGIMRHLKDFEFAWAHYAFEVCNLGKRLEPQVKEILEQIPSTIQEHHKRHMEAQAKKSCIRELKVPDSKPGCIVM